MSGSSLGLRSASYGSLQQQLQNGAGLAQLQIQISPIPVSVRKTPSKMLLQGSRDKERVLNRICKVVGRRRVGMFLLLVVSAVVFCSLFSFVTKEDDTTPGIESGLGLVNHNTYTNAVGEVMGVNSGTSPVIPSPHLKVNLMLPVPISDSSHMYTEHPCANFSFMPPPISPKRTGPRRKFSNP